MHTTSDSEFGSFVSKFRNLWAAGKVAQLNVECHHGVATVGLRVQLGRAPAPVHRHHGQHQHQPGRRKSPAQQRRKARRAAERAAAAKEEAEKAAKSVVEDSIDSAVRIAEKAVAQKEAEKASIAWARAAVIAVGSGVATTAKKIAEKAVAVKRAEEAAARKRAEEAAAKKKAEDDAARKKEEEKAAEAEAARVVIENEPIVERSEVRISVGAYLQGAIETETGCDMMRVPPRYPAPEWFCVELYSRKHHGNVKYLISDQLKAAIGHHSGSVIQNYQFARRLWAYMSHFPINANEFIPSDRFAAVFGSGVKKWDDLRSLLSDHVFFNSSYVGVFSGKKLRF